MTSNNDSTAIRAWLALVAGGLAGLAAAYWLQGFGWSLPGELEEARRLGIVSQLILMDYPKSLDLVGFLLVAGLPIVGAVGLWWPFRAGTPRGEPVALGGSLRPRTAALVLVVAFAVAMLAFWHETLLRVPNHNDYVGAWPLLGEQGATLAWIQSLASGGVFGRDFFSLYGPMFVYPLYGWMQLTGDFSVLADRHYKVFLSALAFALLALWLFRSLRLKWLAVLFVLVFWLIYPPLAAPTANTNVLRSVLAIFAVGCVGWYLQSGRRRTLLLGGAVLGQSFLFSQEAAMCAALAAIPMFFLGESIGDRLRPPLRERLRDLGRLVLATAASAAPMVLYLVSQGAGAALIDSLVGYPRLVMLGFGGLPFADLRDLAGAPREHAIHYAVIAIYVVAVVACAVALLRGDRSPRVVLTGGLALFGLLLFRQALARSGTEQTIKVMIPSLLISALWLDALLSRTLAALRQRGPVRSALAPALLSVGVVANLVVGILGDPVVGQYQSYGYWTAWKMPGKFAAMPTGTAAPQFERLKVFVDPPTAATLAELRTFLDARTKAGDPVYFFPNEAAYYFLLDRSNPTRYAVSYFASTFDRQREIVADLERTKVRHVVVSRFTWRVDGVPETRQLPLVVDYLKTHYRLTTRLQHVDILERV